MGYICKASSRVLYSRIIVMKKTITTQQLLGRLNRAEGQIRALKRQLESDTPVDCKAFITQVRAARSALKAVGEQFILDHLHTCQQLPATERDAQMAEAVKLLSRD